MAVDESLLGTEAEVVACMHEFDWFPAPGGSQLFVISEIRDLIKTGNTNPKLEIANHIPWFLLM